MVTLNLSAFRETNWHEYLVRFALGGLITVVAGLIASLFGPVVGGLFLAFPSIFPASATLVEKHERRRKERNGLEGKTRGKLAAGVDAAGAALGSIGLGAFGFVVWQRGPQLPPWMVLTCATLAWAIVSAIAWRIRMAI